MYPGHQVFLGMQRDASVSARGRQRFPEAATSDENDAKPKYWTNTQGLEITEKWREFKLHVNSKWQTSDSSWKFLKKKNEQIKQLKTIYYSYG